MIIFDNKEDIPMASICAQRFTDLLDSKKLNYSTAIDSDGDFVVEFPYSGKVTKMFFSGNEGSYLSMYLIYERVPADKVADVIFACNELNSHYKWVTFYVDKDNDVVLHDDAILSIANAADEAFELLLRMLKIADEVKPQIMRAIYA